MAPLYQFVMRSGPTPGATFSLEGDQLTIGRDSASAIAINDAEISRKHARLTFQGGKYVIEDLGSTNGTFVNGQRLASPVVLKSGDVISLGEQIVLMFEALSSDPGATVVSARKSVPRAAVVPPPPPPPPQQYYAAPPPPPVPPEVPVMPVARPVNNLPIFIVIGVLAVICLCAAALWYIDSNYLWCTFLPFLTGCP
ncbi:MAG: FHA domain-containing protein [Anaerolineae bacterium]